MKKSFRLLITIICIIYTSSVYAQWTTSGSNVSLTTTTNNVIVGPTPSSPTQLHLNGAANPNLVLSIENSPAGYPGSTYAGIQFKGAGMPFQMYTNQGSQCGYGYFHMSPIASGAGIHFLGSRIIFATSSTATPGSLPGICGNLAPAGTYSFDAQVGATSLNVGYNNLFSDAASYKFVNSGASYFKDKVVIGTTSTTLPTSNYKLYVGGSMICEELVIKLQANWPDFVFSPSYKLKPLSEVKSYIAENNHLPDVPAACEVEENGVATSEMLTIQMKKIEELTLYMIQMQEENEALKKRIEALEVK